MIDSQQANDLLFVNHAIDDAVRTPAGRPVPLEFSLEGLPNPERLLDQGTNDELDNGRGDRCRQPRQ